MNLDTNVKLRADSDREGGPIQKRTSRSARCRRVVANYVLQEMSPIVLPAVVPVTKVTPGGRLRAPVQLPTPADTLEQEMRAVRPPASAKHGLWRVADAVQAVRNGGVLLMSAGTVTWTDVALPENEAIALAIVPGLKIQTKHCFVKLIGSHSSVGEYIAADTRRTCIPPTQVGDETVSAPRFRILPNRRSRGGSQST